MRNIVSAAKTNSSFLSLSLSLPPDGRMVKEPEKEPWSVATHTLHHALLLQLKVGGEDSLQSLKRVHFFPLSVPVTSQPLVLHTEMCVNYRTKG